MRTLSLLALTLAFLPACSDPIPEPDPAPRPAKTADAKPEPTELEKEDLKVGTGDRELKTGDEVKVHYTGRLWRNGVKFDSSIGKDPFDLKVGEGVIEGWSQGVVGMKKGGKRKLVIPSKLGYGDAGSPPKIPPKTALVFEIELLSWKDEAKAAASASAGASASAAPSADAKPPKKKPGGKTGDAPK